MFRLILINLGLVRTLDVRICLLARQTADEIRHFDSYLPRSLRMRAPLSSVTKRNGRAPIEHDQVLAPLASLFGKEFKQKYVTEMCRL